MTGELSFCEPQGTARPQDLRHGGGSGAFLVQVCRYLAERLVEAWEDAEKRHPGVPGITPEGTASTGAANEQLIPKDADERLAYARRIVAQRCLYGVDKNPLAVEMAKLSLWLLTLGKDKPFTFLDHAIRCGDSLVGVNAEQLKTFSLDGQGLGISLPNFLNMIPKIMEATRLLRVRLEKIADDTIGNVQEKQRLFANIRSQTKRLNFAADRLLAASWQPAKPAERIALLRTRCRRWTTGFGTCPPTRWRPRGLPIERRPGALGRSTGLWNSPRSSSTGAGLTPSWQPAVHGGYQADRLSGETTGSISSTSRKRHTWSPRHRRPLRLLPAASLTAY